MNVSLVIRLILFLAFFQGVFSYIGIPVIFYRTILEILLIILFAFFIHFLLSRQDKSFRGPGLVWFGFFSLAVFASAFANSSELYPSFRMFSRMLWPYLFFLAVLNINLSHESIRKINRFIVGLIILQIPAVIYKYITYGVREGGLIGTFSTQAGAQSTMFPLFIICYIIAFYYCYKRNPFYLLLIPFFMFFAWGGGKRAFFVFLPALLLIAYLIYTFRVRHEKIDIMKMVPTLSFFIMIIGITLYIGGRYHPVFNPENERWGSFDLHYMVNQTLETQQTERQGGSVGRISTSRAAINHIIYRGDFQRKLLGDGPDRLIQGEDRRLDYGIRYGISGSTFHLISSGIIGTVSVILLFAGFGFKALGLINRTREPFLVSLAFGSTLAIIVFFFDYFFYSMSFTAGYTPSLLFFYIMGLLFKMNTEDENLKSEILNKL
jgi:hypothetical protein